MKYTRACPHASPAPSPQVRREREKAKDLEGIDTANIVSFDGRRPRRAAASAVNFS